MRLYGLLGGGGGGGGQASVCVRSMWQTWGEWGEGMLPREISILVLLLDTIWWNLGLFLYKYNLPFIVSLKIL